MSGPKTSHYTLTLEQRRILEEQRKIRLEREILTKQLGDARSIIAETERLIEQMEPLFVEIGADTLTLSQVKMLHKAAVTSLSQASSASDKGGAGQLHELNQNLRATIRKLTAAAKTVKSEYASAEQTFRSKMAGFIDGGFDFAFDTIGEYNFSNSFAKSIQAELTTLTELPLTGDQKIRVEEIRTKFEEIEDPDFLKNFYAMTVLPFAKECRSYHTAYAAQGEEYERKCFIYESNARKLGMVVKHVPFSAEAIAVLDARIREMEMAIQRQDEQAYISKCVDEAMQEMGYSVVGNRDVVKRNGKRFRNELYLFDEGTAVNVTYSNDGQITMELGGIGTDDRIPTATESASLASDMRTFCDDYYEIEKRLRKKGIITERLSILPPDEQYAQIINVSDYTLSTDVAEYEAKSTKKHNAKANTQRIGE